MPDYWQTFALADAPVVYAEMLKVIALARTRGELRTAEYLEVALIDFRNQMREIASETKVRSEEEIKRRIESTARRAAEVSGDLMGGVVSDVIQPDAAMVGVGRITDGGMGDVPYWRAQEYGLEEGFVGRVIKGYFTDIGGANPQAPDQFFAGRGTQPEFQMDSSGGFGTIKHPIRPRHFMERGADTTARWWLAQTERAVNRTARQLARALSSAKMGR